VKPESKKNIAFIGTLPPPLGGVGIINKSFQDALKTNWNVLSFNTSNGRANEDLYKKKGLKSLFHFGKNIIELIQFLAKNKFKTVNVFATSNVAFIRDSTMILLLWLCKKQIIVHFHSKKEGEFFLNNFSIKYVAFIFKFAKKIIVLSDDHFAYFSRYFNASKLVVIENFVDYDLYNCKIENKRKEFLYVSRLSEKKGFFDLIDALKILKEKGMNFKINVLGTPENDEVKSSVLNLLKQYNLEQNIVLYGSVQGEKKYEIFKKCSLFLFPSHFENSPVVLKEALAAKMAIIASNIEANKIILSNKGNTKFFRAGDSRDLAEKMEELLTDPEKVNELMHNSENCEQYDKKYAAYKINRVFCELSE
jgi:glycosyltransferase involved in cell wall biosynthesis